MKTIEIKADGTTVEYSVEGSTETIITETTAIMLAIVKSLTRTTGASFEAVVDMLASVTKDAFAKDVIVEINLSELAKQKGEE